MNNFIRSLAKNLQPFKPFDYKEEDLERTVIEIIRLCKEAE